MTNSSAPQSTPSSADPWTRLETLLRGAIAQAAGVPWEQADPVLVPAKQAKFGDLQANAAMALAKKIGTNPRELAGKIADRLQGEEAKPWLSRAEVAGPGFINLTLNPEALGSAVLGVLSDDRAGMAMVTGPDKVVVDYSSPNVAKQMHVGHLRSTIIGDAIARVLAFQGHEVVRQNHLGDWGTQFGMLIENLLDTGFNADGEIDPAELTVIYKASKKRFDDEPDFNTRAKQRVVKLQGGDEETLAVWQKLVAASKTYFQSVYDRLGVELTQDDACGESFYNDRLPGVVDRLEQQGLLQESNGAKVVFAGDFKNQDGEPLPLIVQKSDGGFLYATTDLAAALYRTQDLGAGRVVYVIGQPQRQHFDMFTAVLDQADWLSDGVRLEFVGFGSVLGEDRKMFKTRSGDTVRLIDLIEESVARADRVIAEKNPELPADERADVAEAVGMGSLKYADLSGDRIKDYVFDWDRMLALEGNTAPYLLYSVARIHSIFRKGERDIDAFEVSRILIRHEAERALALQLMQFSRTVQSVAESLEPHRMCGYLYELATRYHRFFEGCPVLKAEGETRESRLALCKATASVLSVGLGLLGIRTVERM